MTTEQKQILREQVQRVQQARQLLDREVALLRQMLILVEPGFADPASGLVFEPDSLEIHKPLADKSSD